MRVLALDTTTTAGSVAIVDDEEVVVERRGDPARSLAERLPTDVLRALEASGLALADIDVFAIAVGPGAFTGLRIGIATIQGFAFAGRRAVVPVSALAALAESADVAAGMRVGAWMNAHRRDVFSALYQVTDKPRFDPGRLIELEPPAVADPAALLAAWEAADRAPRALIGDGAELFAGLVPSHIRVIAPPALAGIIGQMGIARARAGEAVNPAAVQPLYIRRPDVEIAREAARAALTPAVRIEPLTSPDELDALLAVEEASFTNPWTRDMYLAELQNPGASFLLLAKESAGQVVGFCGFWRVLDELHINNLAVLPEHRRRGVASAILARVFDEARALGAKRTLLEVRRSNEAARHLYERFGFTVAGVRRGYYRNPEEDALVLSREGFSQRISYDNSHDGA
jgi:tRNA threonylcarbamoyl adenosine modification protein YeaZ/ribosomal-protein-alanine acetyltransferase